MFYVNHKIFTVECASEVLQDCGDKCGQHFFPQSKASQQTDNDQTDVPTEASHNRLLHASVNTIQTQRQDNGVHGKLL